MTPPRAFTLTAGPVLYHWGRQQLLSFYADLADTAVDTVVLGEVVCARRRELRLDDWLSLARELTQAGKQVVLASQALVETEADLRLIERMGEQSLHAVEAGDTSALQLLAGRVPLLLGPHINIYSRAALQEHADLGLMRWVAPVEVSLSAVALINPPTDPVHQPDGRPIESEYWAFGRLPLAFSARCFTARHHGLPKDGCSYRCLADPDGILVRSTEQVPFLVLNGTQTQSAAIQCLLQEASAFGRAGVRHLRLSPCSQGFAQVVQDFDRVFNQGATPQGRTESWMPLGVPSPLANGYAHGRPGMQWADDAPLAL